MSRRAPADHPIHDVIAERWSPVVFSPDPVPASHLQQVLEAARWAASCFNEQPWRLVVGRDRDTAWQGIHDCLVEANRRWARHAPVLLLSVARTTFARNDKPNRHAWHDVGQASALLSAQATALGLHVHPMAGFDADAARERFGIPAGYDPVACLALGRRGDLSEADEDLAERDRAPRRRRPLPEFVFGATWDEAAGFLAAAPTDG